MPRNMTKVDFTPSVCECCEQTTNYITSVDKGITDILRAFGYAIKAKGVNIIHPTKEMVVSESTMSREETIRAGKLTTTQAHNLSRARSHGLIFRVKGHYGNWGLTRKGIDFLRGGDIPKYAIIDKITGNTVGYWKPEELHITMKDVASDTKDDYWSETIQQGRVISA